MTPLWFWAEVNQVMLVNEDYMLAYASPLMHEGIRKVFNWLRKEIGA